MNPYLILFLAAMIAYATKHWIVGTVMVVTLIIGVVVND